MDGIYALFDRGASIYLMPPMISRNDVVPTRQLQSLSTDPESIIQKHPHDFELHQIGIIDIETGALETIPKRIVAKALDFQPKEP